MDKIKKEFTKKNAWGISVSIDLYNCNPDKIRRAEEINRYVVELCELIEVTRFGDCTIVHFGEKEEIAGFSMVQLIETSLISGHFANKTNTAYIDVFSCKYFSPDVVVSFSEKFFEADKVKVTYTHRK